MSESGKDMGDGPNADRAADAAMRSFLEWADDQGFAGMSAGLPRAVPGEGPATRVGEFIVHQRIGRGGMGEVFLAEQESIGRRVAIKLLRGAFDRSGERERFRREVQLCGQLDHPAIAAVIAAGVEDEVPWYAMQFVPGRTLSFLLERSREAGLGIPEIARLRALVEKDPGEPLSGSSALAWTDSTVTWTATVGMRLAFALEHAHERGIIHRDVKPSNIMIRPSGEPVLLDFGLARHEMMARMTDTGQFVGTLAYASPEQVAGQVATERSDVHALGATLYEMLCLARPHDTGHQGELVRLVDGEEVRPLPIGIPRALDAVVRKALSRAPGRRYPSAAALARDLQRFLAGEPVHARPPGILRRSLGAMKRHPVASAVLCGLVFGVLGLWGLNERARFAAVATVRDEVRLAESETAALIAAIFEERRVAMEEPDHLAATLDVLERADRLERRHQKIEAALGSERLFSFRPARRELARVTAQRVRLGLAKLDDVLAPDRMRLLTERLIALDDEERWAALTETLMPVSFATTRPARCLIERFDSEDGYTTVFGEPPTPFTLDLKEGSYRAVLTEADGTRSLHPFIVRRAAARGGPGPSPGDLADIEVDLNRLPVALREEWMWIPRGASLVGERPVRWIEEPSFAMARHEVTNAAWIAMLESIEKRDPEQVQDLRKRPFPRFLGEQSVALVERSPNGVGFVLAPFLEPDWPVRGISRYDATIYEQEVHEDLRSHGWRLRIPTSRQWERAARGADGRRFPWGNHFDRSALHDRMSASRARVKWQLDPVGSLPVDTSPFEVQDLALSLSEFVRENWGTAGDSTLVRGGSMHSVRAAELEASGWRGVRQIPHDDIGVRFVLEELPDFLPASKEAEFVDSFHEVDPLWRGYFGDLDDPQEKGQHGESHHIGEGQARLEGGVGNGSLPTSIARSVQLRGDFRWTASFSRTSATYDPRGRGIQIWVRSRPNRAKTCFVRATLSLFHEGQEVVAHLQSFDGELDERAQSSRIAWKWGRPGVLVIEKRGERAAFELKADAADEEPVVRITVPVTADRWDVAGFTVANLAGVVLELDEVRLERF